MSAQSAVPMCRFTHYNALNVTSASWGLMEMAAARTMDPQSVSGVALGLLRNRGSKRWSGDPSAVRRWIERQLADVGGGVMEMSGIELHREIEAGIPGS